MSVVVPVTFKRLTEWLLPTATKEYQTSSFQPFSKLQEGVGVVADCVAPEVVPAVTVPQSWLEFTVNEMAPVHSSLPGGGGGVPMHILKEASVVTVEEVVNTLT